MPMKSRDKKFDILQKVKDFPVFVHLSITYVCNSNCLNCPFAVNNSNLRKKYKALNAEFMPEEIFLRIIDECAQYKSYLRITGGGEPFLYPRLIDIVEYAKKKGCGVGIITNGSLVSPEISERLLSANVDAIEFSVDAADKKTYAKFRKSLDWDRLIKNIEYAFKRRNALNSKTKIITSYIKQKGIKEDKVRKFWESRCDNIIERKFLTWGILNNTNTSIDKTPILERGLPCPYPFERTVIDSLGKIRLCNYDIEGITDFGDIREVTIREVWNGEKLKRWREYMIEREYDKITLCRDCQDRKYRSWNFNYSKVLKEAERKRISVVDKITKK